MVGRVGAFVGVGVCGWVGGHCKGWSFFGCVSLGGWVGVARVGSFVGVGVCGWVGGRLLVGWVRVLGVGGWFGVQWVGCMSMMGGFGGWVGVPYFRPTKLLSN